MTDAEYRKEKARVKGYVDKWRTTLGLGWFRLNFDWERSYSPKGHAALTTMDRWQYREFDVLFFLPNMAELTDERCEEVVIHELAHCLTAPFAMNMNGADTNDDYRRDIMEQTTTIVANAIEWAYQAGEKSAKVKKVIKAKES